MSRAGAALLLGRLVAGAVALGCGALAVALAVHHPVLGALAALPLALALAAGAWARVHSRCGCGRIVATRRARAATCSPAWPGCSTPSGSRCCGRAWPTPGCWTSVRTTARQRCTGRWTSAAPRSMQRWCWRCRSRWWRWRGRTSRGAGQRLGLDPAPFVMATLHGASRSFLTPYGYQTNLMVMSPGRYTLGDFVRTGLPVALVFIAVTLVALPVFFPFVPAR